MYENLTLVELLLIPRKVRAIRTEVPPFAAFVARSGVDGWVEASSASLAESAASPTASSTVNSCGERGELLTHSLHIVVVSFISRKGRWLGLPIRLKCELLSFEVDSAREDESFKLRPRGDEGLDEGCPRHMKGKHIVFDEITHVNVVEVSSGGDHVVPSVVQGDPEVQDLLAG